MIGRNVCSGDTCTRSSAPSSCLTIECLLHTLSTSHTKDVKNGTGPHSAHKEEHVNLSMSRCSEYSFIRNCICGADFVLITEFPYKRIDTKRKLILFAVLIVPFNRISLYQNSL